jgi:DNA-binding response OmpR family regulator
MQPKKKIRILCVEEHEDVADLISFMLKQQGYEVKVVRNCADCLRLAASERFDLYILNDGYSDCQSIDLCERLRLMDPQTPVLFLSENISSHDRAKTTGVQAYLNKPRDFVSLVQTVEALVNLRR